MVFPVPLFIELMNVQRHYIQIQRTKSRQNWTINVEGKDLWSRMKFGFHQANFHETHNIHWMFMSITYFNFYPNQIKNARNKFSQNPHLFNNFFYKQFLCQISSEFDKQLFSDT